MLTQNLTQHKTLLAEKVSQIDRLNAQIQELSATQKQELDQFLNLQCRAKLRDERFKKIENLRRVLGDQQSSPAKRKVQIGEADEVKLPASLLTGENYQHFDIDPSSLPSATNLRAQIAAYGPLNTSLATRSANLKSRSLEVESLYRRAVSLCTGVPEVQVEESLGALVAAVESERGGLRSEDAGRVRGFLMKVEGVGGVPGAAAGMNAMGGGMMVMSAVEAS